MSRERVCESLDRIVEIEEGKEEALDSVLDMKFGATCINHPVVSSLYGHIALMLLHVSAMTSLFLQKTVF